MTLTPSELALKEALMALGALRVLAVGPLADDIRALGDKLAGLWMDFAEEISARQNQTHLEKLALSSAESCRVCQPDITDDALAGLLVENYPDRFPTRKPALRQLRAWTVAGTLPCPATPNDKELS